VVLNFHLINICDLRELTSCCTGRPGKKSPVEFENETDNLQIFKSGPGKSELIPEFSQSPGILHLAFSSGTIRCTPCAPRPASPGHHFPQHCRRQCLPAQRRCDQPQDRQLLL
jgi:hypothetical protein